MALFEEFDDQRVQSGVGCALYYKNSTGKYSLFIPLETVPSVAGNPESIEYDVTTSSTKGKIPGKVTLEEKETDIYNHRDNMRRLESFKDKTLEFLKVLPDYSGEKFTGKVSFSSQDSTSGEVEKATMKITPSSYQGIVENCFDLIQPTCHFTTPIESVIYLSATDKKAQVINVGVEPASGTVEVVSETPSIATATCEDKTVTITPVAKGSTLVRLTAKETDCAEWETSILVIVE